MDGSAAAAEAAEDAAEIIAGLESDVQSYVRLRLASAVLREGIERPIGRRTKGRSLPAPASSSAG